MEPPNYFQHICIEKLLLCFSIFLLNLSFALRADTLTAYISHNETLGSSPSGRGFRANANYYITEDDLVASSYSSLDLISMCNFCRKFSLSSWTMAGQQTLVERHCGN